MAKETEVSNAEKVQKGTKKPVAKKETAKGFFSYFPYRIKVSILPPIFTSPRI